MARVKAEFLNRAEIDLIHDQSLKCLWEIGINVHSIPVLELLEKNGARVDFDEKIAKIPESMVNQALESVQKEFVLCARNPEHDLKIPTASAPWLTTSGLAIFVNDYEAGEYRDSTRDDIATFTRLGDAVDSCDYLWTSLTARDVTPLAHGPHELWVTMQNTTKHVQGVTAQSAEDANVQIELAALIAGGREQLRKRPLFSVIVCPVAPLTYEEGSIEAQVELAKAGIPVASMSMSVGGLSAPLSVAGMMENVNTENLGSLVISQMAAPGAPHIYCSESAPMNLITAALDYSAVEKSFLCVGLSQMADSYGMPSLVADVGWGQDVQGGIEDVLSPANQLVGILGGSDLITGLGSVDAAKGISFEQFIIDSYMCDCSKKYMHEVQISEEKIGLDAIREVGHGNDFLTHPHTIKHLRGELASWEQEKLDLLNMDKHDMPAEAHKIVKNILDTHQVDALADNLIAKGDAIIAEYEAWLGSSGS